MDNLSETLSVTLIELRPVVEEGSPKLLAAALIQTGLPGVRGVALTDCGPFPADPGISWRQPIPPGVRVWLQVAIDGSRPGQYSELEVTYAAGGRRWTRTVPFSVELATRNPPRPCVREWSEGDQIPDEFLL